MNLQEWLRDERVGGSLNHLPKSHMASDLVRYLFLSTWAHVHKKSPVLKDYPEVLLPNHTEVQEAKVAGTLGKVSFSDRFKVQQKDKPSSTITCHLYRDGHSTIHYDSTQCRSLSVREAARLQTFPDNYLFCGSRAQQYKQVGNAVPPYLANQIASLLKTVGAFNSK